MIKVFVPLLIWLSPFIIFSQEMGFSTEYNKVLEVQSPTLSADLWSLQSRVFLRDNRGVVYYEGALKQDWSQYSLTMMDIDPDKLFSHGDLHLNNRDSLKYQFEGLLGSENYTLWLQKGRDFQWEGYFLVPVTSWLALGLDLYDSHLFSQSLEANGEWYFPLTLKQRGLAPVVRIGPEFLHWKGSYHLGDLFMKTQREDKTLNYALGEKLDFRISTAIQGEFKGVSGGISYDSLQLSLGQGYGPAYLNIKDQSFAYSTSRFIKGDLVRLWGKGSSWEGGLDYSRILMTSGGGVLSSQPLSGPVLWKKIFAQYGPLEGKIWRGFVAHKQRYWTARFDYYHLKIPKIGYQYYIQSGSPGLTSLVEVTNSDTVYEDWQWSEDLGRITLGGNWTVDEGWGLSARISQFFPLSWGIKKAGSSSGESGTSLYGGFQAAIELSFRLN